MKVDVLLGLQWGDEGKGKIVDYLAGKYDIVARFQGGPNAGHTLVIDGQKFVLHTIPSGIFQSHVLNLIGNGVVINPITLKKEIEGLLEAGIDCRPSLYIAEKAHLIMPSHLALDAASEHAKGKAKIGSTLRGIGPTYMDKTGRNGLRVGNIISDDFKTTYNNLKAKHIEMLDKFFEFEFDVDGLEKEWFDAVDYIKSLQIVNGEYWINQHLADGKKVLAEGAQGTMLDIDFGTYPFVTSSNTITAGACTGLGVSPSKIGEVIGITKAYCTRVGSGPFPSELHCATGEKLRREGGEFGATTGRPRRCGWMDLPALKYTVMLNGVTQLAVTKVDVLNNFDEIEVCDAYDTPKGKTGEVPMILNEQVKPLHTKLKGWMCDTDQITNFDQLPGELDAFVEFIEQELNTPVTMLSTGPEREKLMVRGAQA